MFPNAKLNILKGHLTNQNLFLFVDLGLGDVDAVEAVLRSAVDAVEFQVGGSAGVDDVMNGAHGNGHGSSGFDSCLNSVHDDDSSSGLDAEELIDVIVHFLANIFLGLQIHGHQLLIFARVNNKSKVRIGLRYLLD